MRSKLSKGIIVTTVSIVLFGCGGSSNKSTSPEPSKACVDAGDACVKFTVLHTNDNHGRFYENSDGEYGMAARKTKVDQIREEVNSRGGYTLVFSGGDINTGVPESDLQDGIPDFIGMNLIDYSAMAIGNHEFDNPLTMLDTQQRIANFPLLSANIFKAKSSSDNRGVCTIDKKTNKKTNCVRAYQPYQMFELGSLKIGVIGLTTPDTAKIGNPQYVGELEFTDPVPETRDLITQLKNDDDADIVFAITHMGHYPNANHGNNAPGDVTLARGLEEGQLAAIFGGHTQQPVCMKKGTNERDPDFTPGAACTPDLQKGTYIMQAGEFGKMLGRADFEYYDNQLHLLNYKLIPINLKDDEDNFIGEEVKADVVAKDILTTYHEDGSKLTDQKISEVDADLIGDRKIVRKQQTNLGKLIASAQRTAYKRDEEADFGIVNAGGIRASITAGNISYRDALTVQPFGNTVYKFTMTGANLIKYLSMIAKVNIGAEGSGGYPQFDNIAMAVDCTADGAGITIRTIGGKAFDVKQNYSFTIPSYNAAGGDDYPILTGSAPEIPVVSADENDSLIDVEVLREFLEANNPVTAAEFSPVVEDLTFTNSESTRACLKTK